MRLTPVPPSVRTLLADFTDIDDASRAVSAIIAAGIIPAGLEMVDGATIRAVEASVFAAGMPTDAEAALLVELDGLEAGMDEEVERVRAICTRHGARSVRLAADEAERKRLWAARKGAFGAMGRITPDILIQDAVVPRSRLPEVLAATYRIGARYGLRVANVFHAGDGNLHPLVCFDSRDADAGRARPRGGPRDHGDVRARGRHHHGRARRRAWTRATTCRSSSRTKTCARCCACAPPSTRRGSATPARSSPCSRAAARRAPSPR